MAQSVQSPSAPVTRSAASTHMRGDLPCGLHRHGEFGQQVWQAVASASPGESLQRYADAVRRAGQ